MTFAVSNLVPCFGYYYTKHGQIYQKVIQGKIFMENKNALSLRFNGQGIWWLYSIWPMNKHYKDCHHLKNRVSTTCESIGYVLETF